MKIFPRGFERSFKLHLEGYFSVFLHLLITDEEHWDNGIKMGQKMPVIFSVV